MTKANKWNFIFWKLQIEYSDDEEIGCKDFTSDFYRLVNIASGSTRSLQSAADASDTDESIPNDRYNNSPTPSEAGLVQLSSCSSSDSSEQTTSRPDGIMLSDNLRQDVLVLRHKTHHSGKDGTQSMPSTNWRRSNGWRRVSSQYIVSYWFMNGNFILLIFLVLFSRNRVAINLQLIKT